MLRKVYFHGSLEREPVEIYGDTLYEIIDGLSRQIPELQPVNNQRRVIEIDGCLQPEDLHKHLGDQEEIHIYPALIGAKSKFTQIIVGATLIAFAFFNPGLASVGASFMAGGLQTYLMQFGAMLILGGIAQMLAPQPETDEGDGRKSGYLGSGKNTVAIGTTIPILYGEYRCAGHYLSFDVNSSRGAINA